MKIKHKLTIQFTFIVALIVGLLLGANFLFFKYSSQINFDQRLLNRAKLATSVYIKESTYKTKTYLSLKKQFMETPLPSEAIQIYNDKECIAFGAESNLSAFPDSLLLDIQAETPMYFDFEGKRCVAIRDKSKYGDFVLLLSAMDDFTPLQLATFRRNSILSFLAAIILSLLGGLFFSNRALKPMLEVVHQVQSISPASLDKRVEIPNEKDEIGELGNTFNEMLTRVENAFNNQKYFISNASHELRTPLTAIIGELEVLLMKDREGYEYRKAIKSVHNEAEQLKEMLNLLLSVNFLDNYKQNELVEVVRLDEIILDLYESVTFKNKLDRIHVDFETLPENELQLTVNGNRYLLMIVFKNLIENALKFSDDKPIQIVFQSDNQNAGVKFIDQGIGISEVDQQKVFQTFYRAENAISYKGTGIGLVLCQRIIKLHRGYIFMQSKLDIGTEMYVQIPNVVNK